MAEDTVLALANQLCHVAAIVEGMEFLVRQVAAGAEGATMGNLAPRIVRDVARAQRELDSVASGALDHAKLGR